MATELATEVVVHAEAVEAFAAGSS